MEENLLSFIEIKKIDPNLDAAARFVHKQIIELAKSALDKSKDCQLTCAYFDERKIIIIKNLMINKPLVHHNI